MEQIIGVVRKTFKESVDRYGDAIIVAPFTMRTYHMTGEYFVVCMVECVRGMYNVRVMSHAGKCFISVYDKWLYHDMELDEDGIREALLDEFFISGIR